MDVVERRARMRAAGMYGLLSEIIASGALHHHYGDDHDLIERIKYALWDHEEAVRAAEHSAKLLNAYKPKEKE